MTEKPQDTSPQLSEDAALDLMRSLLQKEGTWVEWGKACQKLQKAGYDSQTIFERTGFQSSQQNLIIVAAQVYESLVKDGLSEELLSYFQGPRSDVLYEFRILDSQQRAGVAQLAYIKKIDVDTACELAKAVKLVSRLSQLPDGFSPHPGDALAYQCWKQARQKKNLQERSRLIAQGLKFAHSQSARDKIEQLLSDFTIVPSRTAPLIPIYRLEVEEELPCIIPVAGTLPLSAKDLAAVETLQPQEPWRIINYSGSVAVVPIPGWQIVLQALDPVALFIKSDRLPKPLPGKPEEVLVIVDRQVLEWNINSYFAIEQDGCLAFHWFEEPPNVPLLGQVILVLRPKKILDENAITQPWQMDD